MRTDIHLHLLYDCRLLEEAGRVNQLLPTWEDQMGTILIVLLVLFLLGGGGWGYSRWRG